ncbi:MAG: hypothetical protein VX076_00275, partial [Pseudomonadota bacterium]|nr:hypothetical protein [Pseudomonadota bacterium]
MDSSVTQLEQHLVVFTMAERLLSELKQPYSQQALAQISQETFANFPRYLNVSYFQLTNNQQLTALHTTRKTSAKPATNLSELGIKQVIQSNKLLFSTPYYEASDGSLRMAISYLSQLSNAQPPLLMVAEINLNSQYNPWRYNILDKGMEI